MEIRIEDIILNKVKKDLNCAANLIDKLQGLGYGYRFELNGSQLKCTQTRITYRRIELVVDEFFIMKDVSTNDKHYTIYALSHRVENLKGIFIAI